MRLMICALGVLLGCAGGDDGSYPIRPGTGGGGGIGGGATDARVDAAGDGGVAIGRVCLVDDLRFPDNCAATGAAGISIRRGTTVVATTAADGTFDLSAVTATGAWQASRVDLITSVLPAFVGSAVHIPAITITKWTALLNANGLVLGDGQGSLHVTSRRPNGLPKASVSVATDPGGSLRPYYAGADAKPWDPDVLGVAGVALVPGLLEGTLNAVAGVAPDGTRTLQQIPVVASSITFVRLDFLQ